MRRWLPLILAGVLLAEAGCRARRPEVTSLQRKEAATLASEAEFAMSVRDLPRAEGLLMKVVALTPDAGDFGVNLGAIRMRLGNRDGAKKAYEGALKAYEMDAKLEQSDSAAFLQQVSTLALLGRIDDARKLMEKIAKKFPNDPGVQTYVKERHLDEILADPSFKEISL